MKRLFLLLVLSILLFLMAGCIQDSGSGGSVSISIPSEGPFYSSIQEVTAEKIAYQSIPANILNTISGFQVSFRLVSEDSTNGAQVESCYVVGTNGRLYGTQFVDYPDGTFTHLYFSNDLLDPYMYAHTVHGHERSKTDSASVEFIFKSSILGYDQMDSITILSSEEKDGLYEITLKTISQGAPYSKDELLLDPETGRILSAKVAYPSESTDSERVQEMTFLYDENLKLDTSPKEG